MSLVLQAVVGPENARSYKIVVAAALAGVKLTVQPGMQYGVDNETCEYMRRSHPLGRYPTLQTPEGPIFESNSILRHFARIGKKELYGSSSLEAAEVDMWLDFCSTELDPAAFPFVLNHFAGLPIPPTADCTAQEVLTGLDNWLEIRTFLVGERMTLADVAVAFSLQWFVRLHPDAEALTKKFKNAYRLYNTVMQQQLVADTLKAHNGTFGLRKVEKPKEEPKKKEEKKEAKKEEKKPAKEDDDDGDDTVVEEKKKPNPLDALPPSSFVLDAFKREYSNTDTRTVAAPYFFANFDSAGFSAFWCRYKYNEDNKMQFMTANLIRGWFQRMEHTRKYAFGVALIIGEEKRHEITALWVFRGKGLPEIVRDVEDTELFDWEEIPDINAQKEKITDYLCWEGPTIGLPVLEGKCFK